MANLDFTKDYKAVQFATAVTAIGANTLITTTAVKPGLMDKVIIAYTTFANTLTVTYVVEDSDDGSTWAAALTDYVHLDISHISVGSGAAVTGQIGYVGRKKFYRIIATFAGTGTQPSYFAIREIGRIRESNKDV